MIFDRVFEALLSACGAGLLTLIIIAIKWFAKKIRVDNLTIEALAHDAYYRHARYLLECDEISEAELENHNHLYEAYHAQGLNGTGDKIHQQILEMKVVTSTGSGTIHKIK